MARLGRPSWWLRRMQAASARSRVAIRIYGPSMPEPRRNTHPTVKPVALMRWLVRLTCPPGAVVLDPFTGSGTTGIAALHEHRRFIGIERDAGYARIARARLRHAERPQEGGPD